MDRRIAGVALPAMIALLTDPLYDLSDTAILGHLGAQQLAGAAIATRVLSFGYATFVFVMFATTAAVARRIGAGQPAAAVDEAVGATWLGAGLGVASAVLVGLIGQPLISAFGATGAVAADAWTYLWVSLAGFPALLIVMAGVGYHRGIERARVPLIIALVSVTANLIGEVVLIIGLGFGVGASAATTVAAKWGSAIVYLLLLRRDARRHGSSWTTSTVAVRRILDVGAPLVLRTAALLATLAGATALAARQGTTALAAHSIAFAIWSFTAYVSDGTEAAGQTLVAHGLGSGSLTLATAASRRVMTWAIGLGVALAVILTVTRVPIAELFSADAAVSSVAASTLWWVIALQPINAVAFSLDGVLIGAGQQRALAIIMIVAGTAFCAVAAFNPAHLDGLDAVWAGIAVFMIARLVPALWLVGRVLPGQARTATSRKPSAVG